MARLDDTAKEVSNFMIGLTGKLVNGQVCHTRRRERRRVPKQHGGSPGFVLI